MQFTRPTLFCLLLLFAQGPAIRAQEPATPAQESAVPAQGPALPTKVFGYRDFALQSEIDRKFLAVPDKALAAEEMRTLTAAPHVAGSVEDYATAVYLAQKFKAAGLDTKIVEYKAWMNLPREVYLQATDANGAVLMTGPSREHVDDDRFEDDPRVLPAFNGSSPSGDVTADVVYANYGRPQDFAWLEERHVDVRGKLVIVRYGANFRGVKVYIAQQHGAAGVILYSDPADDGYFQGDQYPHGPWRPGTAVQRGSVQYLFKYPGDATTPGVASVPNLPDSQRLPLSQITSLPSIPSIPLSFEDAAPVLKHLGGLEAPRDWQGALSFSYHVGGVGAVRVHLQLKMDYAERSIWDVVGKIQGVKAPDEWVLVGNHRDAWVYGAADPGSGTVAMLEAVHGIGSLLSEGWKPKRTLYFCSWDAEEEGLIGSTEWAEEHAAELAKAVAYFNTDVAVTGPRFEAFAVPSLKEFVREISAEVPSPQGGSVYQEWQQEQARTAARPRFGVFNETPAPEGREARVGDLGSGSDFTPFLQHLGVPSTDIGSVGPYGVYHSVFDNYAWFVMNADPGFAYEQQMARMLGLEALHMADTDVLPYDYVGYGRQILGYLESARTRATSEALAPVDFRAAFTAAERFETAATAAYSKQSSPAGDLCTLNASLRRVETDLLAPQGLPDRPWYKHTIYAPGEYTGYAAVAIPGVNEAIDARDPARAQSQLEALTAALNRAAATLEGIH
ncbi:MAG TPA: M28 family metallopeptidase [Acidobacteriaceae bacterium]|nr:M28 family metallopeptidase [Acidobacteriaceae bacterium]